MCGSNFYGSDVTKWKSYFYEITGEHKNFKNSLTPLCSTQQVSGLDCLVGSGTLHNNYVLKMIVVIAQFEPDDDN